MGAPAGLRDTASASGRFASPCPAPAGSRSAWQVWGRTTPANPSRRGSRNSGQTADMVLLVVQIETCSPEQRVGSAL